MRGNFAPADGLTVRRIEVLAAIAASLSARRSSPTCWELALFLGKRSSEATRLLINKLIRAGYLDRVGRRLVLTDAGHDVVYGPRRAAA